MKIYRQRRADDNLIATLHNLIGLLGVKVTNTGIDRIRNHPDYPSLKSVSDLLNEWNIDNLSVNLSIAQLHEIPYPAVAYLNKNGGHFVVLTKLKNDEIHYLDPDVGLVIKPIDVFAVQWSGIALLVEPNNKSGEPEYDLNRRQERSSKRNHTFMWALWMLLFLLPVLIISGPLIIVYLLKGFGSIISLILFRKQSGMHDSVVDSFCMTNGRTDCDAVIKSPASRFFGLIYLSELGVLYFAGGLLAIVMGSISSIPIVTPLFFVSISGLGFSIFSIYYQGMIVKKWCTLCLGVMIIIWIEFGINLFYNSTFMIDLKQVIVVAISFLLPFVFWVTIRQNFFNSLKLSTIERRLSSFLRNEKVFQTFLADQRPIDLTPFKDELVSSDFDAPIQVTMVSNPVCAPCALAHAELKSLEAALGKGLKIVYRFAITTSNRNSTDYKVLSTILEIRQEKSADAALNALLEWYQSGFDFDSWKKKYKTELRANDLIAKKQISDHAEWSRLVGISQTPTFFINGMRVPDQYTLNDLKYHLKLLTASATMTK